MRTKNVFQSFGQLKFFFIHGDGEYIYRLPFEAGMRDMEARMATLAFVEANRIRFRKNLHWLYLPLYDRLCAYMDQHDAGAYWAPYSGMRTFEEQLALFQKGRTPISIERKERIVTWAQPGDSAHNWGCATDWAEFRPEHKGTEAWSKANWRFYQEACRACNLDWGGDWDRDGLSEPRETDYPHNQLALQTPWKLVGNIYRNQGEVAAMEHIKMTALTTEEGERI